MTKEELEHDHIKEIAENYINESWGSYLDLNEVDLVMAGIGVGKIIASEQEKRIAELESTNKKISGECHKLVDTLERKQKEIAELEKSCDETQELLDKQIEATYKLDKENAELKEKNKWLEECKLELADFLGKANDKIAELEEKIEEMKCDVKECFGFEYNILVAKLLNKWEIKEK